MRDLSPPKPPSFAALVQQFFTEYLVTQRAVSPRTIASYRDAWLLFLAFVEQSIGKAPTALRLADIGPDLILAFLDHLEQERHNSVRSRNLRLTALRAFLKFAGRHDVTSLHSIERALAVPMKRFERPVLGFLSPEEMLAVLGEPGESWTSRRDHLLLALLYNTGARVSEIIEVRVADVVLDGVPLVHLHGKGRKQRAIPLSKTTAREIRYWLRANRSPRGEASLLPNRKGQPMTRSNVEQRLELAVARASTEHPGLRDKRITPHIIRHTTAMHMLQSRVPFSTIALWLGHESANTTHRYVKATLAMKEEALARLEEPKTKMRRYRPRDELLEFLRQL
ncbi:MAG: Tyrosine recombinase XerC [Candidatus Accumulibacter regalis]|uniref:Tyrosine recombinase XerC n=1 Tax=Accumulibacter regalis TaxID=522306 RepID=A0A011QI04_ACCRE|nr:tyrosine-type recombinase/integrase [Accumulibacter sp.]EXI88937.1 MAG: Tyrosine recombinase XerC [Candidatus Accumulibacter regalis]HRE72684.1 tyrosine-type recombinase/integrase [Accumulibacter sp.]